MGMRRKRRKKQEMQQNRSKKGGRRRKKQGKQLIRESRSNYEGGEGAYMCGVEKEH